MIENIKKSEESLVIACKDARTINLVGSDRLCVSFFYLTF
jgi:hypothetical protein